MENIKIIIGAVVLGLIGLGVFIYFDYQEQMRIEEERKAQEQALLNKKNEEEQAIKNRTKCTDTEKYFVVTLDRDGGLGQDIVTKSKTEGFVADCKYTASAEDFELKNTDPQYFKAIAGKGLVTDVGTGPSGRMLRIYDLTDKSMITEKKYFGEFTIASSTLTYFGLAKQTADKKNCKEYDQLMKDFGNANLVVEKNVDLNTFLVKETKNTKCVAEQ